MVECVKCHRYRSEKFMQEAVFRSFVGDEGVGIWRCASTESCKKARKTCNKCGHYKRLHKTEFKLSNITVYECAAPEGMGNWCGCEEDK